MTKLGKSNLQEDGTEAVIQLSPFALKKLGILSNQTQLKVDTYNLVCLPYHLSKRGSVLLGSFSREEITFFQRFKGSLAGLSLVIQPEHDREPRRIFCRCALSQFAPMKGQDSLGLITADFRPCPPELEDLMRDYFLHLDRLRADFRALSGKPVPVNPGSSRAMGFNNYATLTSGNIVTKLALFSLGADRLVFLAPMQTPDLEAGCAVTIRLFFRKYQFNVEGRIQEAVRMATGIQKGTVNLEFSPELVDLLEQYLRETGLTALSSKARY